MLYFQYPKTKGIHKMNNSFFALVFRQRYIKRWGLMRNVNDENLAEHSAQVAMIAHSLALIGNKHFNKRRAHHFG